MRWRPALTLLLTSACGGCTLLGAGLGSQVDRYETVAGDDLRSVHLGDHLEVRGRKTSERERSTLHWKGTYDGFEDGSLVLRTDTGAVSIALGEIDEIRVLRGTEWLPGLIAGAVADTSIVVLAAEMGPPSVRVDVSR
jgi:hypothetical protein